MNFMGHVVALTMVAIDPARELIPGLIPTKSANTD
jgi:hypothetical protein